MLRQSAIGFGSLALSSLLAETTVRADGNPLAPRAPHFPPRASRVIFLFMHGGPSQVDTFDWKPRLQRDDGQPLPFARPRVVSSPTGNLLRSPFRFRQHGQAGLWASELFPHFSQRLDDVCMIHSMRGSNSRHGGALLELHTGSDTFVRPSMGSWITYGLGTENQNLPGFITICPTLTHGGVNNWSSAFLPAVHQGTPIGNASTSADRAAIPFMESADGSRALQRMELDLLNQLHRVRPATQTDSVLESRIASFELAFRMQTAAPEVQNISSETAQTRRLYGLDEERTRNFGRQCLLARRFVERGVRFVQVTHSYKWDQHDNLRRDIANNAAEVDRPMAGLLQDLKRRGLLEETLVVWGGEFGRTPVAQGRDGRDHNPEGFTMWLAGAGVKPGQRYGATDDYGYFAVDRPVHFHDLHATILHLLGLDHERLTFSHGGRDYRLTDVHGRVVRDILV
jgi:hypothetical protein